METLIKTATSRGRMADGIDPVDVAVGQNVRAARTGAGLTQSELGSAIGVTFQQIQKYERGVNRISASMLVRIAAALGVPVISLFPGDEDVDLEMTPGVRDLAATYAKLSPANRAVVVSVAKALAGARTI
ncbi:helix-turn-helix domain-containing protein [Brevundimonas sp. MF30-B]|uniref:helix-turn-helix domain-containing protein n=1 Tax=unclassified Brevundimonas TaxID=2622653 RepID=UPI00352F1FCD